MSTDEAVTTGTPARDRAERGRTVIDDRVRRKLIEHAVLSVPGTERRRGLAAGRLPAVRSADRDGDAVDVRIAAQWPFDAARVVPAVRAAIDDELERSLGSAPDDVLVHVARVSDERTGPGATLRHRDPAPATDGAGDLRSRRRHAPRRVAGASLATVPLLLGVLALGVLAVRDTAVSFGWVAGSRWLDAVPRIADDVRWSWWAWPATVGAIVLGLVLVAAAITPRRRSHTPVTDDLWFSRRIDADRRTAQEVAR